MWACKNTQFSTTSILKSLGVIIVSKSHTEKGNFTIPIQDFLSSVIQRQISEASIWYHNKDEIPQRAIDSPFSCQDHGYHPMHPLLSSPCNWDCLLDLLSLDIFFPMAKAQFGQACHGNETTCLRTEEGASLDVHLSPVGDFSFTKGYERRSECITEGMGTYTQIPNSLSVPWLPLGRDTWTQSGR